MRGGSFTADGQVAIVGGRNMGDEYLANHEAMNYADLDVVVIGPVVREVSNEFDLYWNNRLDCDCRSCATKHDARSVAAKRAPSLNMTRPRSVLPTRKRA